jgi:Tfp pilus assembly major pilin PilA
MSELSLSKIKGTYFKIFFINANMMQMNMRMKGIYQEIL